jgi:putative DNA primase/helicase
MTSFDAFTEVCVASRRYFWLYTPNLFLKKNSKNEPVQLTDSLIRQHIQGKSVLGLSPFVDDENLLYGAIDFDVHKPPPKVKELKIKELGVEGYQKYEEEFLAKARKEVAEDLPRAVDELKKNGYLFFVNSSGSEGRHLRVYSNAPMNAKIMRHFLLDLQERLFGNAKKHEVFPKQNKLDKNTPFGNQLKAVLAIHPKTRKLAGIVQDGAVLDRSQSLKFIEDFAKKIPHAKEIKFDIPPELEKKYKSVKFVGAISSDGETNCPNYCAGFEEVACKVLLPSGSATRHDYLDGNAFQYLKDKPQLFRDYCSFQGRDRGAFNKCEGWRWSCKVIHKYLRKNEGEGIALWKEKCASCPLESHDYLPDLKPLFEHRGDVTKRDGIILDLLKSKVKASPLELDTLSKEINLITDVDETTLMKTWHFEYDKLKQDKTNDLEFIQKKLKAQKRVEFFENSIKEAEGLSDEQLLERIKESFIEGNSSKLARFLTVMYILRKYTIVTDIRTDGIKAYSEKTKYYEPIGKEIIKNFLTKKINLNNSRANSEEILHLLKTETYVKDEQIEEASPLNLIPFKNCILDLNTMKMLDHDPKYLFDFQIPVIYDPSAKCPKIEEFLQSVINEQELSLIYDIFGLSLYRMNFLEKFFVFTGEGSNGKSRVLTLLQTFIGSENSSSITLKQLTEDRFAVARTYKKHVNIGADISGKPIEDTSMLKGLSSSDKVSGQFKFGQIFDFVPWATEIFSANDPPVFYDNSQGMMRRCELIVFPHKFGNDEDIREDPNCLKADPHILDKIQTPQEMSGLLNHAIKHLKQSLKNGQLSVVRSTTQLEKDYTKYSNSVKAFVNEFCAESEYFPAEVVKGVCNIPAQGFLFPSEMYPRYVKYCEFHNLSKKSRDYFGKRLKKLDDWNLEYGQKDYSKNGDKKHSVRGIKWKDGCEGFQPFLGSLSLFSANDKMNSSKEKKVTQETLETSETQDIRQTIMDFDLKQGVPTAILYEAMRSKFKSQDKLVEKLTFMREQGYVFNPAPDMWKSR